MSTPSDKAGQDQAWTAGPWVGCIRFSPIGMPHDFNLAWLTAEAGSERDIEARANARLIAAAPELAGVAQLYLDWGHLSPAELEAKYPDWDRTEGVGYIDAKARAALAKAQGGEPS